LQLKTQGVDINAKNAMDRTIAHIAAMDGQLEVLKRLFEYGLELSVKDENRSTPVHLAAIYGRLG
jgi:ankyrin repeat protein